MTKCAIVVAGNMRNRFSNGEFTVMAFLAARRQRLKYATDVTRGTIDAIVIAIQWKAGCGVIEITGITAQRRRRAC